MCDFTGKRVFTVLPEKGDFAGSTEKRVFVDLTGKDVFAVLTRKHVFVVPTSKHSFSKKHVFTVLAETRFCGFDE